MGPIEWMCFGASAEIIAYKSDGDGCGPYPICERNEFSFFSFNFLKLNLVWRILHKSNTYTINAVVWFVMNRQIRRR